MTITRMGVMDVIEWCVIAAIILHTFWTIHKKSYPWSERDWRISIIFSHFMPALFAFDIGFTWRDSGWFRVVCSATTVVVWILVARFIAKSRVRYLQHKQRQEQFKKDRDEWLQKQMKEYNLNN